MGEVRGGEAVDMLQSFQVGHDGSMSTGHGNSPRDMLSRLETMVLMGIDLPVTAIRRQIASGIDIMVHLGRMRDRTRKVLEIVEVTGYRYETEEILTKPLFTFREEGKKDTQRVRGRLVQCDGPEHTQKLANAGLSL